MKTWFIVVGILVVLAVVITIRVRYELKTLQRTDYILHTNKLPEGKQIKLAVISDLHNRHYGEKNGQLIEMIKEAKPDYILAAGDLITASNRKEIEPVMDLLVELSQVAPVYYSPGNHEKRIAEEKADFPGLEEKFRKGLEQTNAVYLENKSVALDDNTILAGLDIDYQFYDKLKRPSYELLDFQKNLQEADQKKFNILMAHSPKFFSTYAEAGYDLVFSGHYHGGAVRLPGIGGVISPQFVPFPKYSKGKYVLEKTTMLVSSGCGSHKVNLRLFNKPEVMVVEINGHCI
ncbi:MAG: metallophosphoesterase [Lachnospiraceae bacterium]|nr:metallophosphoesterase [Lachnospiraceae bacterium]